MLYNVLIILNFCKNLQNMHNILKNRSALRFHFSYQHMMIDDFNENKEEDT